MSFQSSQLQQFNGTIGQGGTTTVDDDLTVTDDLTVNGGIDQTTVDAAADALVIGVIDTHATTGVPAAGIGAGFGARAEITGGTNENAGAFAGRMTDVTAGAHIGVADVLASRGDTGAGAFRTAMRARHPAATPVNFLEILSSATGIAVRLQPSDGAGTGIAPDADVSVELAGRGTGVISVLSTRLDLTNATPSIRASAGPLVIETTNGNDNIDVDPAGAGNLRLLNGNIVFVSNNSELTTSSPNGNVVARATGTGSLRLQSGAGNDGVVIRDNGGTTEIGFFGAAVIARPAGPAELALAAVANFGDCDARFAAIQAAVNALRAALNAAGLGLVTTV